MLCSGGGGGGRGGRSYQGRGAIRNGLEGPIHSICNFDMQDSCRHGNNCQHMHGVMQLIHKFATHDQSIQSLALFDDGSGPKILSGSLDSTVKLWNLNTLSNVPEFQTNTGGPVYRIQVGGGNTIMWSTDATLDNGFKDVPVGMVYLFKDGTPVPIKVMYIL